MIDRERGRGEIAKILGQPAERLQDEAALLDLVTDSMILVDMIIELQEEFSVRLVSEDIKDVRTVSNHLGVFERK